jgi:hypothetical protein
MIPGPTLIKACPICGAKHSYFTILSGNTLTMELYSDGKIIYPMMPEHPPYYKCTSCKKYFETLDAVTVGEQKEPFNLAGSEENEIYPPFKELEPDDYEWFIALNILEFFKDRELNNTMNTLYLRSYNDRTRAGKPLFNDEEDKEKYESICRQLLEVRDESIEDNLLFKAELHRNLGEFDKSIEYIARITEFRLIYLLFKFRAAVDKEIREVVRLDMG